MNRFCIFSALCTLLCFTFGLNTVRAEESKVDMSRCITLTVKQGEKIKLDFAASTTGVWVKVSGVKDEKEEEAPTQLHGYDEQPQYEATGTEIKVYGAIDKFRIYHNEEKISAIDISHNLNLTYLSCSFNKLSSLDVSQNANLTYLNCGFNELSSLDVTKNVNLTFLSCGYNRLSSLDVSQNVKLSVLEIYESCFSTSALNDIYCQLPDRTGQSKGEIFPVLQKGYTKDELLTRSTNKTITDAKNWAILYRNDYRGIEDITGHYTCGSTYALTLTPATMQNFFNYPGGEWKTTVTSTGNWKIDESTLPEWLSVEPKQGNSGTQVTVKALLNPKYMRSGALTFVLTDDASTKQVVIFWQDRYQYGAPLISVTPLKEYTFSAVGETKADYFNVESNGAWSVTSSNAEWFPIEKKEGEAGSTKVTIKADANNNKEERSTELTFALKTHPDIKQEVTLKQKGASISVTPSQEYTFPYAGETKTYTVESSGAWTVTASNAEWLTIEPKTGEAGTTTVTVKADANNKKEERSTELTFALKDHPDIKQEVTLKQKGAPISVMPSQEYTFPYAGETKTYTVESSGAWMVTASNAEWLTIEPKAGEAGTTTVTVKAEANNKKEERSTELTFALKDNAEVKQVVTVKQAVNPNAVEDVLFAGISVAPNPFSSQLRIRNEEAVNARYELVNSNGVAVRTGVLQGVETVLNTEKLPAGAYLLRILSGSESKTLRVVKE